MLSLVKIFGYRITDIHIVTIFVKEILQPQILAHHFKFRLPKRNINFILNRLLHVAGEKMKTLLFLKILQIVT